MPNRQGEYVTSAEAAGLANVMSANHAQNRTDIEDLKNGQSSVKNEVAGVKLELASLVGAFNGVKATLRVLAWIFGIFLTGLGVLFASLALRGKIADNHPPSAVSSSQHAGDGTPIHY